jgi:hypothetical protein
MSEDYCDKDAGCSTMGVVGRVVCRE